MSLRSRVVQIVEEVVGSAGGDMSFYRNQQRQNDRQFLGQVQSVADGMATVVFPDGSTTEAIIGTRDVTAGDSCTVLGGRIL